MDLSSGGTAIMLAVAAGLWFLYLVPTWVRRREYVAIERVEAATARGAAKADRELRAQQKRVDAVVVSPESVRRQRMRRTRRLASLLMVAATVLGLAQIWLMATTGVTLGAWFVLAATLAGGGVAIAVQRRLDQQAMPRGVVTSRSTRSGIPASMYEGVPARPADPAPWTPVAVPQPLYKSKPAPQRVTPAVTRIVEDARPSATVTPLRADPQPAARAKSGFAAMGIVDPNDTAAPDLDEVLRRRRSAG